MQTQFWGPPGWKFLHSIAFNYPVKPTLEDKHAYKLFFTSMAFVLPCKYCRESYSNYIQHLPIDNYLDSRDSLAFWVYLIHNEVNNKLRKQGFLIDPDPSYEQVCYFYNQFRAKCGTKMKTCRKPL